MSVQSYAGQLMIGSKEVKQSNGESSIEISINEQSIKLVQPTPPSYDGMDDSTPSQVAQPHKKQICSEAKGTMIIRCDAGTQGRSNAVTYDLNEDNKKQQACESNLQDHRTLSIPSLDFRGFNVEVSHPLGYSSFATQAVSYFSTVQDTNHLATSGCGVPRLHHQCLL